jgi:F0F1-type ATP synthase assembly protein I
VFLHADRHRVAHSTAWGIGVFLVLGLALPLYVIHYLRQRGAQRY